MTELKYKMEVKNTSRTTGTSEKHLRHKKALGKRITMKTTIKKLTVIALSSMWLTIPQSSSSQEITPYWEIELPSNVKWMEVNDWGILLVAAKEGFFGFNPNNGEQLWSIPELTNIKKVDFKPVSGTPLCIVEDNGYVTLLDGVSGERIIDGPERDYKSMRFIDVLHEHGGILVEYATERNNGLTLFNFNDGFTKWNIASSDIKSKDRVRVFPLVDEQADVYYPYRNKLLKIAGGSGDTSWEAEFRKDIIDAFFSPDMSEIIVVDGDGTNGFLEDNFRNPVLSSGNVGKFTISALDSETGAEKWSLDYKSKYAGKHLRDTDFLLYHMLSINFLEYETGAAMWKKEPKVAGGNRPDGLILDDEGILYAIESYVTEDKSIFYYLDWDGKKYWKKSPFTRTGIYHMKWVEDGLMFVSSSGANIINKSDGKLSWQGDEYISSHNAPLLMCYDDENKPMLLHHGKLTRIYPSEKSWEILSENLRLQDEHPITFEKVEDGFLITSTQNVLKTDNRGNISFHKYYRAPEQSDQTKEWLLAAGELAAGMAVIGAFGSIYTGVLGEMTGDRKMKRQSTAYLAMAGASAGTYQLLGEAFNRRFREQINVNDFKLILTEKEEKIGLVRVDLNNGDETGFIPTDDRTPEYVIDIIDNILYFKSDSKTIQAYKL